VPLGMVSDSQTLLDALHSAHERYGISSTGFYLLRPDTYVSARGHISKKDQLILHLKAIFS
jgi:3-(3-hydroxy-phenyl)propionate hydroxylase